MINNSTSQQRHFYKFVVVIVIFLNSFSFLGQTTTTLYPDKDALLYDKIPGNNYGTHGDFRAIAWTNGGPIKMRSLIEFDLSTIPSNATITSATLTLYGIAHNPLNKSNASYLQRVVTAWSESTVTWSNQPTASTTNQISLAQSTSSTQNYALDVASHVQDMIDYPANDHGFLLRLQSEVYYTDLYFGSSDYSDGAKHPKLEITFTVPPVIIAVASIIHKKVTCVSGSNSESNGAIFITPSGGGTGSTYTYSWTGPNSFTATTRDLIGLTDEGLYTVTVTPTIGNPTTLTIGLGYSTDYGFFVYTEEIINGNYVNIKNTNTTSSWCMGAGSNNILGANTDGWIEYKATSTNKNRLFGFSTYMKTHSCLQELNYGIYLSYIGTIKRIVNGVGIQIGTYNTGDLLRISREGSSIKFYKNGVDLNYSMTSGVPSGEMHADVSIWDSGASIDNMACSFKPPMEVTATITNLPCGETTGGEIALDPCGTGYTYSWSPGGQTTATISDLPVGTYTVTISGSNNWTVKKIYSIGYDIYWTNLHDAGIVNSTIYSTGTGPQWKSGGNSNLKILNNVDGWVEYEINSVAHDRILGLTENPISTHPNTSVDYGVRLKNDASFVRTESGTESATFGTIKPGDILRIERSGTEINYYLNGYKYWPLTVSAAEELYTEAAFYAVSSQFENVRSSIFCAGESYAELTKELDGYYHFVRDDKLKFHYNEEYEDTDGTLNYSVFPIGSTTAESLASLSVIYGNNYKELDVSSLAVGYYLLEVTNEKNEKWLLKFYRS